MAMKKLLFKIAVLVVAVAVLNEVSNLLFYNKRLPAFWGDAQINGKHNSILMPPGYNTLFIGSSKTHYQVIPHLFDSLVNAHSPVKIHSYNFGIDGMLPPESFYIYKLLLQNDSLSLKNVIIELDFIKTDDTRNMFTWRGFYWANQDTYRDYAAALLASKFSARFKAFNLVTLNIMAAENLYNLSKFNAYLDFISHRSQNDTDAGRAGFEPLPHPKLFSNAVQSAIDKTRDASVNGFANYNRWALAKPNQAYAGYLHSLLDVSKKKGIRLIFMLPPQWDANQYRELFPVLKTIPNGNKIIMAGLAGHPYLFTEKYLFDGDHLNGAGAALFTKDIARQFIKPGTSE